MPTIYDKPVADTKTPPDVGKISRGDRIRALRREADALEQQQHADLMRVIAAAFPNEVFSAGQIWSQLALRIACEDAGLRSPQQLGCWLRAWCERISRDGDGIVWSVSADELHEDAGLPIDPDV